MVFPNIFLEESKCLWVKKDPVNWNMQSVNKLLRMW